MAASTTSVTRVVSFATFELDLATGELHKKGIKVKIEGQPLQLLQMLLEHPGELVSREELKQRLWPADTFVDFEHSINAAVRRLRDVLDDSATTPRFIETLPRRGYRFIYPLESGQPSKTAPPRTRYVIVALVAAALIAAFALAWAIMQRRPTTEITSIAVLPFKNLSADPEQEYFADGLTEMLITELGRVGALRVPSHQTVMQYAKSTKSLPEIARELNVDSLVEGTVTRQGGRVRITVNFVQAQPERHLSSEKYERDLADVFMVQDEVAQTILAEMRSNLTADQQRHFARSRRVDPEVNEAYLKGLFHFRRGTRPDRAKAYRYFAAAVEKDANFAPGYAAIALLDAHGGAYRADSANAAFFAHARQQAMKALELDDTLAEAHTALAWLAFTAWKFDEADREFKRAIELNPNLTTARIWYVVHLTALGRFSEAEVHAQAALRLAPAAVDVINHVTTYYLGSGRFDDAIAANRTVLDLEPNYFVAHLSLGRSYLAKGMYQEAIAELDKAADSREGEGEGKQQQALRAYAFAKVGRRPEALKILRELEREQKSASYIAIACIGLGDNDKAFAWLERAYENHQKGGLGGFSLTMLKGEPLYAPLKSDPRFDALAARIGLPISRK